MTQCRNESRDHFTSSKQDLLILENGLVISETGKESKDGQMAPATRANGRIIKLTVKASSSMLMEISMKGSGNMIVLQVLENIITSMELCTWVSG